MIANLEIVVTFFRIPDCLYSYGSTLQSCLNNMFNLSSTCFDSVVLNSDQ